jgi:hypothetical protein
MVVRSSDLLEGKKDVAVLAAAGIGAEITAGRNEDAFLESW